MESAKHLAAIPIMLALALTLGAPGPAAAQTFDIDGSTGPHGLVLRSQSPAGVDLHFEMTSFAMEPVAIDGATYQKITMPQVFLPNDAGAPDLAGLSRFVAIPEGANAVFTITSTSMRTFQDVDVAPAPVIPRENDDSPLVYRRNPAIFGRDAYYPASPVLLSEAGDMRGVDVVTIGITPFQYNPVTRELQVFTATRCPHRLPRAAPGSSARSGCAAASGNRSSSEHLLNYASLPRSTSSGNRGTDRRRLSST